MLALTVASFPASGVSTGTTERASRTIDLGSSPAPFKRLRPFKELAAQQLLKLAMASFKPFKPQAPQRPGPTPF